MGQIRKKELHKILLFVFIAIFFRLSLEFVYVEFVAALYDYAGLIYAKNQLKYFESWLIYIFLILVAPVNTEKPSDILMTLALFVYITPLLIFYALANADQLSLYLVLMQYGIMDLLRRLRFFSFGYIRNGYIIAKTIAITGDVFATIWMLAVVGFSNFNLDDAAVYDFRDEANSAIYDGLMGYFVVWATNICSPVLLLIFLRSKKYFWVVFLILTHIVWFGISTHKSILFYPFQVIFIYIIFKKYKSTALIPSGLLVVIGIALVSFFLLDNILVASLFARRVFFVPSHLTFVYFDFFNNNPFVYWSNSIFSEFIRYPYQKSVALVIGSYLGDETLWANNSFFSTGFMHAGLLGISIYGIVAGLILSIIDSYARKGLPTYMILAVVVVPFFNLYTSADLTTSLLTHGLGFAIFFLSLLSRLEMIEKR